LQESISYSLVFEICLLLSVALPLLSFVLSFVVADKYSWAVSITAPFLLLLSALASAIVFFSIEDAYPYSAQFTWFEVGSHSFMAGVLINNLSATMLLVVTFISLLIHTYSIGYMAGDIGIRKYFAMLGLFTCSMLCIVIADNLVLLFVGWEMVGFSSYMLIGHWKEKPAAARAAKKAFIMNRIGDAGFLVGLMIIWTHLGSFSIAELITLQSPSHWHTAASLFIFCGVIGKSAQFPLLNWLPDAMEGPTPVSALIHAATMVAAGVYLMTRIFPLFTPTALDIVAVVGIITAAIGAFSALAQSDIKKILAYSTISQLGLMVTALGSGNPDAAFLHLFTHAFFKACLFLAAGSIIHSLHHAQRQTHAHFDVQDIRNLGGLSKKLRAVFIVFVIAGSSLAGLPFFSGFLSKDAILTGLLTWSNAGITWHWIVVAGAFVVTFVTAVYTFRMIWLIFFGNEKRTAGMKISEPPFVMQAPVLILASSSLWIIVSWNPFVNTRWIEPGVDHSWGVTIFSILWVLSALLFAHLSRNRTLYNNALENGFFIDQIYTRIIKTLALNLSKVTLKVDNKWIDGVLHAMAYAQVFIAHVTGWFDRAFVDGTVNGVVGIVRGVGTITRSFQDGKIQLYIFWSVFTIIIFLIWKLL
jgi:NADH-quinone oxidoreductase subunit L